MTEAAKKIPLVECFGPTIQGEGLVIGQQTYFLRFGLCDYRCTMCDSMHAVDPKEVKANAEWLTQKEIADKLDAAYKKGSAKTVTFSGGNPAIHDLEELIIILSKRGWRTVVETQGTLAPSWLDYVDILIASPKGPGMGITTDFNQLDEFIENTSVSCIKVVVFDERDLEFARAVYERYDYMCIPFFLSLGNPYPPGLDNEHDWSTITAILVERYKTLWEQIQCDSILSNFRFLPQWHALVWGNEKGR